MLTARDVTNQSFTPTQFRHGYDERQVDDFLDQVVETLRYYEQGGRLGEQAPASPARPDFTPTTGRRGYDKREVDDFLDQVVETLRYYQRGGRPVAQAPASIIDGDGPQGASGGRERAMNHVDDEDEDKWWQTILFILVLIVIGNAIVFALAWIFGTTPETVCKIVCGP